MNPIFQYYPANVQTKIALGNLDLDAMLNKIAQPNEATIDIYERIKLATIAKDEKLRAALKSKLYYFTPAVYLHGGRGYCNIKHWTGLMPLDFDKIDNAPEFRDYLFTEYPYIIASWLSSSKRGVRALVNIPACNTTEEYKSYFYGVRGALGIYNGFDNAPKNCVLPLYLSYDADLKRRNDAILWDVKGTDPKDWDNIETTFVPEQATDKHLRQVIGITTSGIDKIVDNGHPQLRGVATALGGYVQGGYISQHEAEDLMINLIQNNSYLSQKPRVYVKTAKEMIQFGRQKPLNL